jgi:TonB family protein
MKALLAVLFLVSASTQQTPVGLQEPLQSLIAKTQQTDPAALRSWSKKIWDSGAKKEDFCPDYEHAILADLFSAAADKKEKQDAFAQAIADARLAIDKFSLMSARPGYTRDDFKNILSPVVAELQSLPKEVSATPEAADWLKKLEGRRLMSDQPVPSRVRVSQLTAHCFQKKSDKPEYPYDAKMGRISGAVIIVVRTDKTGRVESATVKSGHPLLTDSARAAVSHWTYSPFYILSEPVPLEFEVTVNFNMTG